MEEIRLTKHFTLSELCHSDTADRLGIDNTPTPEAVENLRMLCTKILQPLRDYLGRPVVINSGYRCKELNRRVGGCATSRHLKGQAADIRIANRKEGLQILRWAAHNVLFDEALLENSTWVHLSYCEGKNRRRYNENYRV